jgi:hypothetical protein
VGIWRDCRHSNVQPAFGGRWHRFNKGALVSVRVNDSAQLLSANEGKTPGAHLLLGVSNDALFFRNANIVSQDASGRNYQLLIPFGRTINVSVASTLFQLADATGKVLPKSNVVPILVPLGQQAPTLVFTMTAVATH